MLKNAFQLLKRIFTSLNHIFFKLKFHKISKFSNLFWNCFKCCPIIKGSYYDVKEQNKIFNLKKKSNFQKFSFWANEWFLDAETYFYEKKILKISNFRKQASNDFKTSRYEKKYVSPHEYSLKHFDSKKYFIF